jgi:hypothetical protein
MQYGRGLEGLRRAGDEAGRLRSWSSLGEHASVLLAAEDVRVDRALAERAAELLRENVDQRLRRGVRRRRRADRRAAGEL